MLITLSRGSRPRIIDTPRGVVFHSARDSQFQDCRGLPAYHLPVRFWRACAGAGRHHGRDACAIGFRRGFGLQQPSRPFLVLQFDEHTNDAGAMTRCEAYLDSKGFLRWWVREDRAKQPAGER